MITGATWLGNWAAESPEWWAAREHRIGGSEIAAIMGTSPWNSRYSVWMQKAGRVPPTAGTQSMEWGQIHEPQIIRHFLRTHPELTPLKGSAGQWVNDTAGWMLASPDGLVESFGGIAVLEVKTADVGDAWQWGTPGTDDIPVYYKDQVRWYLGTLNLPMAYVAVLIGGNQYREYVIDQDPPRLAQMIREGKEFMDSLDLGFPPVLDAHKATYEAVRAVNPDLEDRPVEVDPSLAVEYETAVVAHKEAEEARRLAGARLLDAMGTGRRAVLGDRTIAMRISNKGGVPYLKPHPSLTREAS